ncbi:MAG: four helix bundle suffix domain-containing protein [Paramuribaculum sp.]|nr:four helix bundle suffix domain-containing protein [Paramuribaculum sp.]
MLESQDNMVRFLRISGDYTSWNVYKKAVIVCDVTEMFIRKAFTSPTRTIDQMRQAARSCKQNIVEGTGDSTVSMEMCIKLIGIAKASARELLEDYRDYLRQNNLEIWGANDTRVAQTRKYCLHHDDPHEFVRKCSERSLESVANIMITQIHQLDTMLGKVLKEIEADFLREGGLKEAMSRSRRSQRGY